MKPFLLIATRAEDETADSEYDQFLRFGGLEENELHRVRLEAAPMPDINLDNYSGVIVGGSPFTGAVPQESKSAVQVRCELEIGALLDRIVPADFPFLGACYGVGTLGRHQGGTIDFTYGESIAAVTLTKTAEGLRDPLLKDIPDQFSGYVGHKEACSTLPSNATLLVTADACPVQMFRIKNNLYGTQFHPELDVPGIIERINIYKDAGYFPAETLNEVIEEVSTYDVTDSNRIIRNFVERYARS